MKPETDGGSPLTGYYVERRQGYSSRFSRLNKAPIREPTFKVSDLIEGDEYEFRVVAENEAGCGKPSETTGTFTAKDPFNKPGKPGKPDVTLEGDSASLSWIRPSDDGRSPITNYVVEMKGVGEIRWRVANAGEKTTKTSYVVRNLQPDMAYEFRVSAENKAGVGQPSAPSQSIKYGE